MPDSGGSAYFQQLNTALRAHERSIPFLLLDLDRVDANIDQLAAAIQPEKSVRVVVKSLPSADLVQYVAQRLRTKRFMVFHQPFLTALTGHLDGEADVLLGKPMPVKTAAYFYDHLPPKKTGFNALSQVQWLVDTEQRIREYLALAERLGHPLRLNLEIDVGLHRGGFTSSGALRRGLDLIADHPGRLIFSGFMGYEPHVVKLPKIIASRQKLLNSSNEIYHRYRGIVREQYPALWSDDLTFNGAGSPTLNLHRDAASPLNDVAAGSCFVKPGTFDLDTLREYIPACFIAAPVLKKFRGTTLPGIEKFRGLFNVLGGHNRQSFFLYGGFWKADYCYPPGTRDNTIFGPSTNQTMINAPTSAALEVDDFVFLRPHQSEFVFLQFGDILTVRGGEIVGKMKPL